MVCISVLISMDMCVQMLPIPNVIYIMHTTVCRSVGMCVYIYIYIKLYLYNTHAHECRNTHAETD